ncbi:MAG TPA: SH3 domain-containing protein [Burkholderiales bacterium]|nr:SH3 domain-containing protein [Burkholderiales bacterium]
MRYCLIVVLMCLAVPPLWATEFRTVDEDAVVLYDAPSLKAQKLYVLGRNYPVEVVVVLENWIKVRDASGDLAWVEKQSLSDKRSVMVNVPLADIRQAPNDNAPVVFQAEQSVLLEFVESSDPGWIKVRHRDGQTGYIRTNQVWGV